MRRCTLLLSSLAVSWSVLFAANWRADAAPMFTGLGDLPGGDFASRAYDPRTDRPLWAWVRGHRLQVQKPSVGPRAGVWRVSATFPEEVCRRQAKMFPLMAQPLQAGAEALLECKRSDGPRALR